jgi:hypothetical protein
MVDARPKTPVGRLRPLSAQHPQGEPVRDLCGQRVSFEAKVSSNNAEQEAWKWFTRLPKGEAQMWSKERAATGENERRVLSPAAFSAGDKKTSKTR